LGLFSSFYNYLKDKEKKELFYNICQIHNLKLDFTSNIDSVSILKEIFFARVYSDYFPFYSNSIIVDIGSHKGYFSLFAYNNLKSDSKIITYEPVKENYLIMLDNFKKNNLKTIISHQKGIYSKSETRDVYKSKSENNSIYSDYNYYLNQDSNRKEKAEFITLSDIFIDNNIEIIDFLKLDVEGAEYDILFNSSRDVLNKIKIMSIEFHDLKNEINNGLNLFKFLYKNGFNIVRFNHEATIINNNFGKIIALNSECF